MKAYFIYEHWRHDTNQCFYVGMGKTPPVHKVFQHRTRYSRAYARTKRNDLWKGIASKTTYDVKIVFETNSKKQAEKMEFSLIKKYGRSLYDLNGTLTNLDVGGNVNSCIKRINLPIHQIDIATKEVVRTWKCPMEIERETGYLRTNVIKCCRNRAVSAYGYIWHYENQNYDQVYPSAARKKNSNRCRGIEIIKKDGLSIGVFRTIEEASEAIGLHHSTVWHYLHGHRKNKEYDFIYRQWA